MAYLNCRWFGAVISHGILASTKKLIIGGSLLSICTCALMAGSAAENRLDEIFHEWSNPQTPGVSVAVVNDGEQIFAKGYGSANLEYSIPVSPRTIYHVASVSKQFTAMALLLLEEDGKLSLDDDVHKYLPEQAGNINGLTLGGGRVFAIRFARR